MPQPREHGEAELLGLADLCVKCGLCLPHCPTYGLSRDEGESPRGRISLIQAYLSGALAADAVLTGHLEQCLMCRACEAACPSRVPYGALMDASRSRLYRGGVTRRRSQRLLRRWMLGVSTGPRLVLEWSRRGLGLVRAFSAVLPRRLASLLPPRSPGAPVPGHYPATGVERGTVSLFLGCVARLVDGEALSDTVTVLNRLGYSVRVPPGQGCCGAMHGHAGDASRAAALARHNLEAFADPATGPILTTASGCGLELVEYGERFLQPGAQAFAGRVQDINAFLAGLDWPAVDFANGPPLRVAVHESCTLRNGLKGAGALYRLLERLPGVEVAPLPGNERCCGAAGTYMLSHPRIADRLLEPKLEALSAEPPQVLVSANVGCAMHLGAGLRRRGLSVEVMHPVSLIRRRMEVGATE